MNKLLLAYCVLTVFFIGCSNQKKDEVQKPQLLLPVFGPRLLGGAEGKDTIYHTIPSFQFYNQYNETISDAAMANKIVIADFFFATCQSICPKMNRQMSRVQDSMRTYKDVLLLSYTVNPEHDSVEVLAEYAHKYKADKGKWHLLTGNKKEIYKLAKEGYLINALEDDGSEEGFLHSEFLLLIDKQKRLRGFYDGTDSIVVNKMIKDIKLLMKENNEQSKIIK